METAPPDREAWTSLWLELPARPQSVAAARAGVADLDSLDERTREAVLIVVSELVTNAVRHAGLTSAESVIVRASRLADRVRVEVVDNGPGFDRDRVAEIPPSVHGGFGLRLVEQLAERWGVAPDTGTVWAEIPANGSPAAL